MSDVIEAALDAFGRSLWTCILAKVENYDPATQRADVSPIVRDTKQDGTPVEMPVIGSVPVMWPRGSGWSITGPLLTGDTVTVWFSVLSIDEWKATGQDRTTPQDKSRFDLSNAVCFPGPSSFATPIGADGVSVSGPVVAGSPVLLGSSLATSQIVLNDKLLPLLVLIDTQLKALGRPGLTPPPIDVAAVNVKAL
jgi:hypothetical protein